MKTVSFSENEIDYIKELYIQELERLKQRTHIVTELLNRLEHLESSRDGSSKKEAENVQKEIASKKVLKSTDTAVEDEINAILKKPVRKGRPRKDAAKKTSAKKLKTEVKGKAGRKKSANSKRSVWAENVLNTLANQDKIMTSSSIIEESMKKQGLPSDEISKIRNLVGGTLITLKKENKIRTVPNPGKRGEFYALTEWFDANGKLDQSKN